MEKLRVRGIGTLGNMNIWDILEKGKLLNRGINERKLIMGEMGSWTWDLKQREMGFGIKGNWNCKKGEQENREKGGKG